MPAGTSWQMMGDETYKTKTHSTVKAVSSNFCRRA